MLPIQLLGVREVGWRPRAVVHIDSRGHSDCVFSMCSRLFGFSAIPNAYGFHILPLSLVFRDQLRVSWTGITTTTSSTDSTSLTTKIPAFL